MLLWEISTNTAEGIPYKNFKERLNIVLDELLKNRYVEVWDEHKLIYSAEKWSDGDESSIKISWSEK